MGIRISRCVLKENGTGLKVVGLVDVDIDLFEEPKEPDKKDKTGNIKRDISVQVAATILGSAILTAVGLVWHWFV